MASTNNIKNTICDFEKQILFFIQKDIEYIKEIFYSSAIGIEIFTDCEIKKIVEIIIKYYEEHNALLVKKEFENIIDKLSEEKVISIEKHGKLLASYEDSECLNLEENQFSRIFKEWISVSCVPSINEIVKKNHEKFLSKGMGIEFIENTRTDLEKIYLLKEDKSLIQVYDLDDTIEDQINDIKKRREEKYTGIRTGIKKVDDIFIGFEKGTLTLIGAVTGGGKSTFSLNVTRNIFENLEDPKNILVVSLEMSEKQWFRKYNIMDSFYNGIHLPYTDILCGNKVSIPEERLEELEKFLKERRERHKKAGVNYKVIEARANKYSWNEIIHEKQRRLPGFTPDLIVLDHLSLFKLGTDSEKRNIALGNLSKEIRGYGQDHQIPMVVIVQAGRSSVQRIKGKREIEIDFENIEGSNLVGEDCDNFIALSTNDNDISEMKVKIVKQRDGPSGSTKLRSAFDYCAIYDSDDIKSNTYLGGNSSKDSDKLIESLEVKSDSDLLGNLDEYIDSLTLPSNSINSLLETPEIKKEPNVNKLIEHYSENIEESSVKKIFIGNNESLIRARNKGMFNHNYNSKIKESIRKWMVNRNI